ncbi:MAG: carbon-nitrogen hydrolase family protein [Candidatus Methanospirareceae archaeon]
MSIDWSRVKESHVIEACSRYAKGDKLPKRPARNTFLLLDGKRYPAKFIRGLAYEIATGYELDPNTDYTGGVETLNFFRTLGFTIEYNEGVIDGVHDRKPEREPNAQADTTHGGERAVSSPKVQKDHLKKLLEQRFDSVATEVRFDWLTVPDRVSTDDILNEIYETLVPICGRKCFSTPGYPLACDFFVPSKNLIIEYDERQHFTIQRAESLSCYPSNLNVGFDIDEWRKSCESIRAVDTDPIYRDEQRAFYDSTRDILATHNGMTLIRIKHGDVDWNASNSRYELNRLLSRCIENSSSADLSSSGIREFKSIGDSRRKALNGWVATVTLQSNDKDYSYNGRMAALSKIVDSISRETRGDGVILFPGGWFYADKKEPRTMYNWAEKKIGDLLGEIEERVFVCIGIDGRVSKYAKDQIGIAISKDGIGAIGRKFHPTSQEDGNIKPADDYLSEEDGKFRIFELNGVKYYMCVCYDTYGLRHKNLPNPGVDVVLNLVHSFYPVGEGSSGTSFFTRHGFAGASKQWDCPVFGAVVFFRRNILQNWPTGVYWNQGSKSTTEWQYVYNPLEYENEFEVNLKDEVNLKEDLLALIRIYDLETMQRTDTAQNT